MNGNAPVLRTENLAKDLHVGEVTVRALRGVSLEVERGEFLGVIGPSGSGKSTLLGLIGGLDSPTSGHVYIDGSDITYLSERALTRVRNEKIGFVFQFFNLIPTLTALENVMMPGLIAGKSPRELEPRAKHLLERLNVHGRADHKPGQMSGGEQQRVAVARALFNDPAVVLADEPSGNLDSKHARELHDLFFELRKEFGQTFVIVTHNEELAEMADRRLVIKDGVI